MQTLAAGASAGLRDGLCPAIVKCDSGITRLGCKLPCCSKVLASSVLDAKPELVSSSEVEDLSSTIFLLPTVKLAAGSKIAGGVELPLLGRGSQEIQERTVLKLCDHVAKMHGPTLGPTSHCSQKGK